MACARAFDAVADGVGKVAVEEQEFKHAIGREIGRVDLAVRFKGRATAQQADELEIQVPGALFGGMLEQFGLKHFEQRGRCIGAFKVAAEANELPSLAVNHAWCQWCL